MQQKNALNFAMILPLCSASVCLAQESQDHVVRFNDWQVNYYTDMTEMQADIESSSWIVRPPIVIERDPKETENTSKPNAFPQTIKVYMQAVEGSCASLSKNLGDLKGVRLYISDTSKAIRYQSYSTYDNGQVSSNIFAIVSDTSTDQCLKLYFYNETDTKLKIGFNKRNGDLGADVINKIVSSAKLTKKKGDNI